MSDSKQCSQCGEVKNLDLFYKRGKYKDGRARHQSWCKSCKNEYDKKAHASGTGQGTNRNKRRSERRRIVQQETHSYVWDYKSAHPCVDCGEDDPVVLEFDHVRGVKKYNIARMLSHGVNAVKLEIAKCEVRCANCHRRVTYLRRRGIA